jgi:hypothetical protein
MSNLFPVFRVRFPDGSTYYGVRPRDTVASFRRRLRTGVRAGHTEPIARAAGQWGTDATAMAIDIIADFSQEPLAVAWANGQRDEVDPALRLNSRPLPCSSRRART